MAVGEVACEGAGRDGEAAEEEEEVDGGGGGEGGYVAGVGCYLCPGVSFVRGGDGGGGRTKKKPK